MVNLAEWCPGKDDCRSRALMIPVWMRATALMRAVVAQKARAFDRANWFMIGAVVFLLLPFIATLSGFNPPPKPDEPKPLTVVVQMQTPQQP